MIGKTYPSNFVNKIDLINKLFRNYNNKKANFSSKSKVSKESLSSISIRIDKNKKTSKA